LGCWTLIGQKENDRKRENGKLAILGKNEKGSDVLISLISEKKETEKAG